MSRLKISDIRKAKPVPISLKPEHMRMLDEMSSIKGRTRSKIIQSLIEAEYKKKFLDKDN